MSLDENIVSEVIKDGVKITTYKDGSLYFEFVDKPKSTTVVDNRSWWQKLKTWWNKKTIKPYIKVRDLADFSGKRKEDPFDQDVGCDGKSVIEVGIKVDF